jgi:hypothetical protein
MNRLGASCSLLLLAGCGSLRGDTGGTQPLATMSGFLSGDAQQLADSHPRVAVVWMQEDGALNVAEDLPVQPVFPSSFVVPLHRPPPAGATFTVEELPGAHIAFGGLVAYDDRNGNGALDLVSGDAGAFIDAVLGGNPALAIAWFEGPLAPLAASNQAPPPGYSLVMPEPVCAGQNPTHPESCDWTTFAPIDHPYELKVTRDPHVSALMCAQYGAKSSTTITSNMSWDVATGGAPPDGYPAAGTEGLACSADGASYTYSDCRLTGPICMTENRCENWKVSLGDAPRPRGWPCP